ncbi:MAG: 23S rRNA (uridine(2552)-2'-O)-methyltransferase RlmE [Gammaproteobacteria bacterium]|nr:23S rRNA (uridine(2552)-2'-O)-methyltransferase RlmE [Gammaproteobacteria bacterium]
MTKSKSSRRWLKEHFDDPYVKLAQQKGYRSRAAFKLLEIQEKDRLITSGMIIVDLGAAPGSWSEIASKMVGPKGQVFAMDILPMADVPNVQFVQGDFTDPEVFEKLLNMIDNRKIDLVISDIAPNISGMPEVDQPRAMYLAELAAEFAKNVLKVGGAFLVKVFQGEGFDSYLRAIRQEYTKVQIRKPQASRPRSKEVYLLARGFKGVVL